jgi:myo-inositol-1(or 4)-monophosphatase
VVELCLRALRAVADALGALDGLGAPGRRPGQLEADWVADRAARQVLEAAGVRVVSEESLASGPSGGLVAVVDPLDGSTNAMRSLPWFGPSICIVDDEGPLAAAVANLATGHRWCAERSQGAWELRGSERLVGLEPSGCAVLAEAVVAWNGFPARRGGWRQYRALGAAALELCATAAGALDGYRTANHAPLALWDYLAGALVCEEAGVVVLASEAVDHGSSVHDVVPRRLVAAGAPGLVEALVALEPSGGAPWVRVCDPEQGAWLDLRVLQA